MSSNIANDAARFRERFYEANRVALPKTMRFVAGYGSLKNLPEPSLTFVGLGALPGFEKDLNIVERRARGTCETPGRVLGLVPSVHAQASVALFEIGRGQREGALAALWRRELDGLPYAPRLVIIYAGNLGWVEALAFIPEEGPDVVSETADEVAHVVCVAVGRNGSNLNYFEAVDAFDRETPSLRSSRLADIAALVRARPFPGAFSDPVAA